MAAKKKEVSVCEYCHIGLKGKKELKEHLSKGVNHTFKCLVKQAREMVRMAKNGERKFVCKECGKGFKNSADLTRHSNVHSKQMTFVCDVESCAKSYTRRSGVTRHKKAAHEGSFYGCPECKGRFVRKNELYRHCKIVHEKKKDYKCVACGAQFGQKYDLVRHTQSVHDKIRAFKCEQCNKSFSEACYQKKHMSRFHSNNPPMVIVKEEFLLNDQIEPKLPMDIIKEEMSFNDQAEAQPTMDIIKKKFLHNDKIEPQPPMVIIKEESLFVEDAQSCT